MNQVRKDVLNGWKEIAAYLGRDPRTVERWEKQRSLPVRRLPGTGRATVYALVSELDAWLAIPVAELERALPPVSEVAPVAAGVSDAPSPPEPVILPQAPTEEVGEAGQGTSAHEQGWRRWLVAALLVLSILATWVIASGWNRWLRQPTASGDDADAGSAPKSAPASSVPGVEDLYLRGSYQLERRSPDSLHRAQEAFSAAIGKDPRYAPAYAGLASTYILLREYSILPDAEAYRIAKEDALKAVSLNPELPQAHAVLGFVDFFWVWDAAAAENEFQTALRLDPHLPLSHHWYGSMLTHEGRYRDGLRELNLAQKLDPSSSAILTMRAFAMGLSGNRDEAVDLLSDAVSTESTGQYHNPATMHQVLGSLNLLTPRDVPRYLSENLVAAELRHDTATVEDVHLATAVYGSRGEPAMWQALLENEHRRHRADGPTYAMARYEAALGSKDQALKDLENLFSRHDPGLIGISVDPLLAPLRQDARFLHLRSVMGLPRPDTE